VHKPEILASSNQHPTSLQGVNKDAKKNLHFDVPRQNPLIAQRLL
jgi:hypothetical protein